MPNAFDRADKWRQRAAELRAIADGMNEAEARASLHAIADALDAHAGKLEEIAVKISRLPRPRQRQRLVG